MASRGFVLRDPPHGDILWGCGQLHTVKANFVGSPIWQSSTSSVERGRGWETPSGGIHTAIHQVLQGSPQELSITHGLTNLTQERREKDIDNVREDVEAVLTGMEGALASTTDAELAGKKVRLRSDDSPEVEEGTAHSLVADIFIHHWREHMGQLAAIREMLGLD